MTQNQRFVQKNAIHAYVSDSVHAKFEVYWHQLGLTSGSSLLTLLILREIWLKRLPTLFESGSRAKHVARSCKITAYLDQSKIDEFRVLVSHMGRSISDCAAELVDRELQEFWLLSSLSADQSKWEGLA